jgi:hypothetical protein
MIKKFKIFEKDYSDIDPYNEERWDGPKELEIDIITPKISDDKQDSFWYFGKTIAILRKEDMEIEVLAAGEIAVSFEEDGYICHNEEAVECANDKCLTDKDLEEIRNTTGFINNNWFEFRINGGYADEFGGDVAYEYDEAMETAKSMIEE